MRRIGVDFDNTIVSYDGLFHRLARERALIPAGLTASKSVVRDYLRAADREDDWTELQGLAYGPRMHEADPFPGVREFFATGIRDGYDLFIVSHKTRRPYRGGDWDLHEAARGWLERHGFFAADGIGLDRERVFFETTKASKLERVGALGLDLFIDDLPELLAEAAFPDSVRALLFDPSDASAALPFERARSWQELAALLLERPPA